MNSPEAKQKFQLARTLHGQGKHSEALALLDDLTTAFPTDRHLMYAKAQCLAALGRVDEARELCEQLEIVFGYARASELKARLDDIRSPARLEEEGRTRGGQWRLLLGIPFVSVALVGVIAAAYLALHGAEPKLGDTQSIDLGSGVQIEMVWIPPGTFMMGSPNNEDRRGDDETQRQVTLSKGFWLGKYEVTQGQWQAVMGSNPSNFKGDTLPVEMVPWDVCAEFTRRLNGMGEGTFRLPTEAEWEYACRAGTTTPFNFGGSISTDLAIYDATGVYGNGTRGEFPSRTKEVGSFPANAWGLHDMHGNVWEWCQDWYGNYGSGAVTDPGGPVSGQLRVLRGGGWHTRPHGCRTANREGNTPDNRGDNIGFRLLRTQD